MNSSEQSNEGRATMAEIKTAEQRIHNLEGGEGDSFVTVEQALIAERDELRAALRKALADRDALQVRVTALESIANSDDGAGGEGMKLYIENRDMKSRLAALEAQEPVDAIAVDDMSDGYDKRYGRVLVATENCIKPLYAAAGAAPEPTKTVDRAWSRFCGCIGRGPDAPYPGMIEAFESHYGQNFTDKDWRNETGIWAAAWGYATRQAGAAPVPEGWQLVPVEALTRWRAAFAEEDACMKSEIDELRAALKERDAEIAKLGADVRTWVNSWTALKEQTTSCIDELRATLAERDAEIEKLKAKFAALDEATMGKLCMQRAVMQQALGALEFLIGCSAPMTSQQEQCWPQMRNAISALKDTLK